MIHRRFAGIGCLLLGVTSLLGAAQNEKELPGLIEVDFDKPQFAKNEIAVPRPGYLVQIVATRPDDKKDPRAIRTLRVEVTGDALEKFAVVARYFDYRIPLEGMVQSSSIKNYSCFLHARKAGTATVRVTPIGLDGKTQESQVWKIDVGPSKVQEKQDDPEPLGFREIDFDKTRMKKNEVFILSPGHLVRISAVRPADNKDPKALKSFEVEIIGDSVKKIEVVANPYREKKTNGTVIEDATKQHLMCFLQSVKIGTSRVRLTPIGIDGQRQTPQDWTINVGVTPKKN